VVINWIVTFSRISDEPDERPIIDSMKRAMMNTMPCGSYEKFLSIPNLRLVISPDCSLEISGLYKDR
jgi:hypothetical protein